MSKNRSKKCAVCGSDKVKHDDFADELSRKEFSISLMCQKCQDEHFEDVEDEGYAVEACEHCGSYTCYEVNVTVKDGKLRCSYTGKEIKD